MTGHTAAAGLVVASQCRSVSTRGRCERCGRVLLAYRHGLRASELCDLQWHQVELNAGRLHVRRSKRGTPSVHPMQGDEIRALRRLQREQEANLRHWPQLAHCRIVCIARARAAETQALFCRVATSREGGRRSSAIHG